MRHPANSFLRLALLAIAAISTATTSATAQSGVTVETDWALDMNAAHAGDTIQAVLLFDVEEHFHVNSNEPIEEGLIATSLSLTPPDGFTWTGLIYPDPVMLDSDISEQPLSVFEEDFAIAIAIEVGAGVAPGTYEIKGGLYHQACNDKYCVAPTTKEFQLTVEVVAADQTLTESDSQLFDLVDLSKPWEVPDGIIVDPPVVVSPGQGDILAELANFNILATSGGYQDVDEFLAFIDAAESGVAQKGMFDNKGLLAVIVLIIIGGALLNLTPCVLPLVPINLAIIGAGAQSGNRMRGFLLGGTYGLAMALVYGILGLVVILTGSAFGVINSTVWFNVLIVILFIFLALAMFDIVHVDFSKYQSKLDVAGVAKRGTFAMAFGMGAVTALLAGACVAPVVIQVIVYATTLYTDGQKIALALPFLLGVGLAIPWPIAGAGISAMPKPGTWMVRVKQAMGVFILAFAVYYGYLAWEIYSATHGTANPEAQVELEGGWTADVAAGLATARAENKRVVIDMWATWCKNCLAMEKTTFKDDAVVARLEDYVKIKYQAEQLDVSPADEVLDLFEGIGLPTYAILEPKEDLESEGDLEPDGEE